MSNEKSAKNLKKSESSSVTTSKRKFEESEGTIGIAGTKVQSSLDCFFKPKIPRAISSSCSKWKWKGTILYYETKGVVHSDKIAAFDFDGTLAKTSLFQHGPDAWSVLYPNCLAKLAALNSNGYKLVIFTNQSAIGRAKSSREKTVAEKTSRLDGFISKASLPFQAFIATTKDDSNFKPSTGMWQFMTDCCNGGISVDKRKSFYVGDAAGRAKDHSAADKNFAEKCGLKYYTETEYFSEQASEQASSYPKYS